jgi:hypothetical protein
MFGPSPDVAVAGDGFVYVSELECVLRRSWIEPRPASDVSPTSAFQGRRLTSRRSATFRWGRTRSVTLRASRGRADDIGARPEARMTEPLEDGWVDWLAF